MGKLKTEVKICGKEYTIVSSETPEYIHKIGEYIDQKMGDILRSNVSLSGMSAAVLAAVNVADEYFKANDSAEHMRTLIGQYLEEESKQKSKISSLTEENEKMKKELEELRK